MRERLTASKIIGSHKRIFSFTKSVSRFSLKKSVHSWASWTVFYDLVDSLQVCANSKLNLVEVCRANQEKKVFFTYCNNKDIK